jgi:hypothetical protein
MAITFGAFGRMLEVTIGSLFIRGKSWGLFIERSSLPRHPDELWVWREVDRGSKSAWGRIGGFEWVFDLGR